MSQYTSILFERPSFWDGAARAADISGCLNLYNVSPTTREADNLALWSDYQALGEDFDEAVNHVMTNHQEY